MPTRLFPCLFEGAVVLANVYTVGVDGGGEFWEIVEDEWDACGAAEGEELAGDSLDGGEVVVFCTELEDVCTASEKRGGDFLGTRLGGVAEVEDAVETGCGEMHSRDAMR